MQTNQGCSSKGFAGQFPQLKLQNWLPTQPFCQTSELWAAGRGVIWRALITESQNVLSWKRPIMTTESNSWLHTGQPKIRPNVWEMLIWKLRAAQHLGESAPWPPPAGEEPSLLISNLTSQSLGLLNRKKNQGTQTGDHTPPKHAYKSQLCHIVPLFISGELDQMTFKVPFQLKRFYN